jgi:hypothetical protein
MPDGGPPSGFVTDENGRTHNVTATLPMDEAYSPLWMVNVYDNADFAMVSDLASAMAANILATGVANVNCPIVMAEGPSSAEDETLVPVEYGLSQNYPNPFNPSTEIKFIVAENQNVTIKVFNLVGEQVAELVNKSYQPGEYSVTWNPENQASGVYYYTMQAGDFAQTKKMLFLK